MDDRELQAEYARNGSDAAFRALVARHLPLVYSAGLRQVRSPDLAHDVSQEVFLDLARRLRRGPVIDPLAPWLLVVTRRRAVDLIRKESRRRSREEEAMATAARPSAAKWEEVSSKIDEAMSRLGRVDREAVVRRYFQRQTYAEMAATCGVSEAAAQKRVSRAMQRLRGALASLGVTAGALFENELFGHAIQEVPSGMVPGVARFVITHIGPGSGAILAWLHRLNHSVAVHVAAVTVALGSFGFGWHELMVARGEEAQAAFYARHIESNRSEAQRLLRVRVARNRIRSAQAAIDAEASELVADTRSLKAWFARTPSLRLPEFESLTQPTWIEYAYRHPGIADMKDPSAIMFDFRIEVRAQTEKSIQKALQAFEASHQGPLANIVQLMPFLGGMNELVLADFSVVDGQTLPLGLRSSGPVVVSRPLVVMLESGGLEAWQRITASSIGGGTMPVGSSQAP